MADKPTWYLALLIVAGLVGVAILLRRKWSWMSWERLAGVSKPVEGATEDYAVELRAMRDDIEPSPDLIRPAEQMDADHEALAEIGHALDHFGEVMTDALSRFLRNQPTVLLRLPSSIEQTGELPVVPAEELIPA